MSRLIYVNSDLWQIYIELVHRICFLLCRNNIKFCSTYVFFVLWHIFLLNNTDGSTASVTPIVYGSVNTEHLYTPDWLKSEHSSSLEDKNDCFTFTYQLPKKSDQIEGEYCRYSKILNTSCLPYRPRQTS